MEGIGYPIYDTGLGLRSWFGSTNNNHYITSRQVQLTIAAPCTQEFYASNNIEEGDAIYIDWKMVLIKNPGQDPSLDPLIPTVGAQTLIRKFDPDNNALDLARAGSCLPPLPYEVYCPGPIVAANDLTLTEDGCNAIIKQTFTLENPIPDGWYANEYRPIMGVAFSDLTVPPNLALCGGVNILDETGALIGEVPAGDVSYPSMTEVI